MLKYEIPFLERARQGGARYERRAKMPECQRDPNHPASVGPWVRKAHQDEQPAATATMVCDRLPREGSDLRKS